MNTPLVGLSHESDADFHGFDSGFSAEQCLATAGLRWPINSVTAAWASASLSRLGMSSGAAFGPADLFEKSFNALMSGAPSSVLADGRDDEQWRVRVVDGIAQRVVDARGPTRRLARDRVRHIAGAPGRRLPLGAPTRSVYSASTCSWVSNCSYSTEVTASSCGEQLTSATMPSGSGTLSRAEMSQVSRKSAGT